MHHHHLQHLGTMGVETIYIARHGKVFKFYHHRPKFDSRLWICRIPFELGDHDLVITGIILFTLFRLSANIHAHPCRKSVTGMASGAYYVLTGQES